MIERTTTTILDLLTSDVALRRAGAREWCGPCPWCGVGNDRLRVWPAEGAGGRYFCRICRASGDAITLLRARGLSYRDACRAIGVEPSAPRAPGALPSRPPEVDPSPEWRRLAGEAVERAARVLWMSGGGAALRHLRWRGLGDDTIRRWRLGATTRNQDVGGLQIPGPAVLIPWFIGGDLWELKARLLVPGGPKYLKVSWALPDTLPTGQPHLFGADTVAGHHVGFLVEGELDAILLHQEAGNRVATLSLGSASADIPARAARYLLPMRRIVLALDADAAGRAAADRLEARFRGLPWHRAEVPDGKDVTEFRQRGGDVRAWAAQFC